MAIFKVYENAERAAYQVRDKGLRTDNISIIVKNSGNEGYYRATPEEGQLNIAGNGAVPLTISKGRRISDGIITGGIIGGIIGIIIGVGSMFLQTLGIIAAIGPISGLFVGLIAGGLIGGIVDFGIPNDKRKEYESLISDGNALFSMKVDEERMEAVIEIIKENGAMSVEKY